MYGLNLPPIKRILPTNLPTVQSDEKRMDNTFELTDDSILILEYESGGGTKNLIKHGHYAFRTAEKYSVSLAKEIGDEEKQGFIIAGILTATDKFIDKNYSNKLKEWLKMTKVGRLFEEEKIEYAKEKLNERNYEIAKTLLSENVDILTIMKSTGLSKKDILKLKNASAESRS